jgi:hypothetical protein
LVDGCATPVALKKFDDLAIGSGYDRSSCGSRDIDCVMGATFGARIRKRVDQLVRRYSQDGNNKFQSADKPTRGKIFPIIIL